MLPGAALIDDRFDAMVNKLDLIGKDTKMEVIAVVDKASRQKKNRGAEEARGRERHPREFAARKTLCARAVNAAIRNRRNRARHLRQAGAEGWQPSLGRLGQRHRKDRADAHRAYHGDSRQPRDNSEGRPYQFCQQTARRSERQHYQWRHREMLAQHLITKPVFDALFEEYSCLAQPDVKAMQAVLDLLQTPASTKPTRCKSFYASVKDRALRASTAHNGKQKIVVELYDKFFRNAFPK